MVARVPRPSGETDRQETRREEKRQGGVDAAERGVCPAWLHPSQPVASGPAQRRSSRACLWLVLESGSWISEAAA